MRNKLLVTILALIALATFIRTGVPPTITIPVETTWTNTGLAGKSVGLGAFGEMYVIGQDGNLYQYSFADKSYTLIQGDMQLSNLEKVAVDPEGTPYVLQKGGQVYYLDCNNDWIRLPGCATDLAISRGGDIWKIGCDQQAGGFGIWNLSCQCKCSCGNQRDCNRFRQEEYQSKSENKDKPTCLWYRVQGGGVRIAVSPSGDPYIIDSLKNVAKYEDHAWKEIGGLKASSLGVSNEGLLFIAGTDYGIYRVVSEDLGTWLPIQGRAVDIDVSLYSLPTVVDIFNQVQTIPRSFN